MLKNWKFKIAKLVVFIIVFFLALLQFSFMEYSWENDQLAGLIGEKLEMKGRITTVEKKDYGVRYFLDRLKIKGNQSIKSNRRIILIVYEGENTFNYGDVIIFNTQLEEADKKRNPGGFCYYSYLKQENIYALANLNSHNLIEFETNKANFLIKIATNLQQNLISRINNYFQKPYNYLLKALLLGDDANLPQEISEQITETGLNHLFVVSGFHIGLLSTLFYYLATKLKLSFWSSLLSTSSGLLIYLMISGFKVPGLRAFLLFLLIALADRLDRKIDIYNLLSVIAILILLFNPYRLFRVGFQLSFGAVIAIASLTPIIKNLLPIPFEKCNSLLAASLAAQLGLLPILAYHFYEVALIGVLVNLFAVPLISLVLILGLLFLFSSSISTILTSLLVYSIELLLKALLSIIEIVANNFWTTILLGRPNILTIVVYYLVLYYLFQLMKQEIIPYSKKYSDKLMIIALSCLLLIFSGYDFNNRLKIIFFDVGQGDAIYFKLPSGENVLVDTGISGREIKEYLYSRGKKQIDYLIVSHFHYDHIGGFNKLNDNLAIGKVIYPALEERNDLQQEVLDSAIENNIKAISFKRGDKLEGPTFKFETLAPIKPFIDKNYENNNSLVFSFNYKDFDFLLTGDIEKEAEERLLERGDDLTSFLLKVAHHGSISSSSKEFIENARPQKSVINVGANNYGHPSAEVIKNLEISGAKVLRTDKHGAIIFWSDGKTFDYKTFLK